MAEEREKKLPHGEDAGDKEILLFADVLKTESICDREGEAVHGEGDAVDERKPNPIHKIVGIV